jgi:hypothetical protein
VSRGRTWTDDQLVAAVQTARSVSDVLRQLGLRPAGGNHRSVAVHIERLELDTSHFRPAQAMAAALRSEARPLADVLVAGSTYSRRRLKERLYASGLKERRCELCGQGETWRDRRMSLILDHINGIADDNRLENLRIVCPNCNATLETHCGRRSRNPLVEVACAGCEEPFTPRRRTQRYCSRLCGSRASKPGPRPAIRRARRPPFDELLRLIEAEGYSAVGRRFGVSDNAIRRWRRDYERAVGEDRPARPRPNEPPELST